MRPLVASLIAVCAAFAVPPASQAVPAGSAAEPERPPLAVVEADARRDAASDAIAKAKRAPDPVLPLADAIAEFSDEIAALRSALTQAEAREHALTLDLAVRRDEIAHLLATVQAMEARPANQTLHPQGPIAAARAAAMIETLAPGIEAEGARLAEQLDEIAALRATRTAARAALDAGVALLGPAREDLSRALAADRGAACCAQSDAALQDLLRNSDTLSALAREIAEVVEPGAGAEAALRATLGGQAVAGTGAAQLSFDMPVRGRIVASFEVSDAAGVRRPGILFAADPMGLVLAPAAGLVRYAGPFLDYRQVVVIEPRAGTLVVLAGLAQLHVASGETVERGRFLGLLGGQPPGGDEVVMAAGGAMNATPVETLYMEVRDQGETVDPEPMIARMDGSGRSPAPGR